jgi:hypothetical protein
MKRIAIVLLSAVALLGSRLPALATPSTIIFIPSTDLQAPKTMHFGLDAYYTFDNKAGTTNIVDTGVTWGFKRFEFGFDHIGGSDEPFLGNAKFQITPEKGKTPAFAIGAYNFGGRKNPLAGNLLYALGSKTFKFGRLQLGYQHAAKHRVSEDENMVLASWDKQFNPKWWGAVDFASGKSAFGALTPGVAYTFSQNTSVIFGYDFYNNSDFEDTITVQVDINF